MPQMPHLSQVLEVPTEDKLRLVTSDKQITVCESRKVANLGGNGNVNLRFNETAMLEIGSDCLDSRFE